MFRCCNDNCRQRDKGFTILGDRVSTDGMSFFKKIITKWRDVRKEIDVIYDNGDYKIVEDGVILDISEKDIRKVYGANKMVCKRCNHKAEVYSYTLAFKKPMMVFDTENLCECGGEIWTDFETVKEESPETESEAWSDGDYQRKVKVSVKSTVRCERCNKEHKPQLL